MKEILKNLVETMTLLEDSYLEQDAEILEIFVEEIEEIFEELNPLFTTWFANPTDQETLVTIRRHFHTLKGSGRMVGAKSAGELAWTVEDTLNRVLSGTVTLNTDIQKYAKTVFNLYQYKLYPIFKQVGLIDLDLRPLVLLGQQLQQNQTPEPALEELLVLADQLTATDMPTGLELADAAVETAVESSEDVMTAEEMSQTEVAQEAAADASLLAETLASFVEEAEEHLATIDQFLAQDQIHSQDYNGLIRALHTLRGSSSMAQIDQVFQASSKVENLFKTFVQDEIESTSKETALLVQYAEFVRDYLHVLRQGYCDGLDVIYATFSKAWDSYGFSTSDTEDSNPQGLVSRLIELNIDRLLDAEFEFDKLAQAQFPSYLEELSAQAQLLVEHTDNRASVGIHQFTEELKAAYDSVLAKPILLNSEYGYELFAQAHQEFIHLFDTLAAGQRVTVTEDIQKTLNDLTAFVQQDIDAIALEDAETSVSDNAVERAVVAEPDVASAVVASESSGTVNLAQLSQRIASDQQNMHADDANKDFDPELLDIFLEEAEELLVGMDEDVNTWSKDASDTSALNNLMRYLHTLKGGANMISATHIGLIAHNLESIYERIINNQIVVSPALIQIIRLVQDDIADRIQTIRDERVDYAATESIAILGNIVSLAQGDANVSVVSAISTAQPEQTIEAEEVDAQPELAAEALQDTTADLAEDDIAIADEASLEANAESEDEQLHSIVVETFREEAEEILDAADQRLKQWFEQRNDRSVLLQLQRAAHSLKGGARMAEIESVAQIAYQLESAFEQFAVHQFNSNVYDALLQTTLAWLRDAIFKADYTDYDSLKSSLSAMQFVDVSAQLPERLTHNDLLSPSRSYEFVQGDGTEPPAMSGEWGETTKLDNSNEMIRISADLVEKMIDLSGENSINRSRIEMELGQLGGTLNEMELAIKRLADQLRRMEGELESQIIAKHGSENSRYADFDPLEMDQYSSLNQLSKSLAESASDLVDFKSTLADKIRDAEGLLLQQSRIQAEIQESLMRTRLVPFSRLLPRLQRIVRQTSSTLNRPTELVVNNTEGELDRTILERLVTPFEHMLRNAVDHGIEDPVQRAAANKSEVGKIELNITRQGTDVVVTFVDDGKGIDDAKIKEKALSLGLIKADQNLDKNEILQYIFHPGFTTAKSVTQISGRGVGLDVVQSEIKALGGHVSVDSTLGQGTTFSIRVPTTVAVSDALMVKVGDQQFAVPLAQIDRIVRIAPTTLESYFNSNEDFFQIDNQNYKLRYLSEFVGNQPLPRLSHVGHSLPVLLIKGSTGQSIALLVDQLIGSRGQIVVKPIGQQFSSIGAIAGATILGDGQVCLILDGQNIARQILATHRTKQASDQRDIQRRDTRRLIMIVDDSVTVRKVTSRLLERQGYDIVTAKDGIDAMEQLENVKPDLMLLDIEMPRMDGFEVTNLVRHHDMHSNLPIIMITSRTGEKHRERAFSLGVTHYMGKPFQEAELLANIEQLLAVSQG
ncbi:hybrid sensor histidine kinase/response regulator [Acinetobacter sp. KAM398]|uniref:hybrid sensor histidine kinase/response regulator n=1 Tax=unclassified Acinetobacter TaxID=196816 RepID=UPI001F3999EC|nr:MULTISPECIES: Hpt domain-containing protein [unclassified Acinetobacter]GJC32486.1 hybrid sensor histidine kinase/response regulator [Acinetobacter sp. KAM392]GJC34708.1 hybrid sensor histidine kinase/response regulator [Acinetobacter sp. KAM393]GJC38120.1 hybrid sensor histidine kinase/response regulator [Acinetobacter sp. KAM394]GJC40356.1 hybrid sensor histidine kinase/response regulator [Acinetobacter sp. KAM395]GJC43177.1 hybrid sensor histidine kinase/response regulator [Acinetobacter